MRTTEQAHAQIGKASLDYLRLIPSPTPLHTLEVFSERIQMHNPILVKREDKTSPRYGGNKVRNLEFILADAQKRGFQSVKTLLPYGSNFSAALSSEARHAGLDCHLHQFTVEVNKQTRTHFEFSQVQSASIRNHTHALKHPASVISYLADSQAYAIAPGASTVLGALGHFRAFEEFLEQASETGMGPQLDFLLLGTGTCGTTAGILAAITHCQLGTKILGVRCADPIVCHSARVHRLANQVLQFIGSEHRTRKQSLILITPPEHQGYGISSPAAIQAAHRFFKEESIILDLTYTSKVILTLESLRQKNFLNSQNSLLYWHTYSSHFDNFFDQTA